MTFPDFTKPPVVEVVCGVLFDPPVEFMLPHIGRFSERLGREFPNISEVNSLPPVIETFKDRPQNLVFARPPLPRVWFENAAGDQLVQLQRDRLLVNWKKTVQRRKLAIRARVTRVRQVCARKPHQWAAP